MTNLCLIIVTICFALTFQKLPWTKSLGLMLPCEYLCVSVGPCCVLQQTFSLYTTPEITTMMLEKDLHTKQVPLLNRKLPFWKFRSHLIDTIAWKWLLTCIQCVCVCVKHCIESLCTCIFTHLSDVRLNSQISLNWKVVISVFVFNQNHPIVAKLFNKTVI